MKTDAAVLLSVIDELASKLPPSSSIVAYQALSRFNNDDGRHIDIIRIVSESCQRLNRDIGLLPRTTEAHIRSFRQAILNIEQNFSVGRLGTRWDHFLDSLQNEIHVQALHFLDYMVSSQDFWSTRSIDVSDTNDIISLLERAIDELDLPEHTKRLLKNDIAKIKFIIENVDRFGEQDYWEKFQKITGLFGSLHVVIDENARKQTEPILRRMVLKIAGTLAITADVATLGTTAWTLLPRL